MLVLSAICHMLFFSGIVFLPELRRTRHYAPSAVEVDLVSLPQGEPQARPSADQVGAAPPVQAEPTRKKVQLKDPEKSKAHEPKEQGVKAVSIGPKPLRVKRSLKKKTFDVSKVITSAIERIEKRAPQSRPSSVLHAIDRLKKKVDASAGTAMKGGATEKAGMNKKALELLDIYNAEIWHRIQKNWAFSEHMARGSNDLAAVIIVKIMKAGEIRDIWFEKRSGDGYFDESVFKAVKKSDPLPPLPEGFLRPYYEVGLRFNLSELKRSP